MIDRKEGLEVGSLPKTTDTIDPPTADSLSKKNRGPTSLLSLPIPNHRHPLTHQILLTKSECRLKIPCHFNFFLLCFWDNRIKNKYQITNLTFHLFFFYLKKITHKNLITFFFFKITFYFKIHVNNKNVEDNLYFFLNKMWIMTH